METLLWLTRYSLLAFSRLFVHNLPVIVEWSVVKSLYLLGISIKRGKMVRHWPLNHGVLASSLSITSIQLESIPRIARED